MYTSQLSDLDTVILGFEQLLSEFGRILNSGWPASRSTPQAHTSAAPTQLPPAHPAIPTDGAQNGLPAAGSGCPMARMLTSNPTIPHDAQPSMPVDSPQDRQDTIRTIKDHLKSQNRINDLAWITKTVLLIEDRNKRNSELNQLSPEAVPDGTMPKVGRIVQHPATYPKNNGGTDPQEQLPKDRHGPPSQSHASLTGRRDSTKTDERASKPAPRQPANITVRKNPIRVVATLDPSLPQKEPQVCPIRFLDFHTQDGLADYFGKHKHEIPRSHQVCATRFQKEWNSQLDATYGSNIPAMIMKLGEKHQPLLHPPTHIGGESTNAQTRPPIPAVDFTVSEAPTNRIEKWKDNVGRGVTDDSEADSTREQRFDRPMRDVRVGESPSRPWGIPVPLSPEAKFGAVRCCAEIKGHGRPPGCPLDKYTKWQNEQLKKQSDDVLVPNRPTTSFQKDNTLGAPEAGTSPRPLPTDPVVENRPVLMAPQDFDKSRMVFTGPVFFGYSPEQAREVMSALNK